MSELDPRATPDTSGHLNPMLTVRCVNPANPQNPAAGSHTDVSWGVHSDSGAAIWR